MPSQMRKNALLLLLGIALTASAQQSFAKDVPWIAEVTTAPKEIPAPSRPLLPFLNKQDGTPVETQEEWTAAREQLKQEWLKVLGPLPQKPSSFELKTLGVEVVDSATRELIEYNAESGRRVKAYLLRPKDVAAEKRPALVVFHPTTTDVSRSVAGLGKKPEQGIALELAKQGFVCICPDNYLWEEPTYLKSVEAAKKRHPKSVGMATMLADGIRAVDLLLTFSDVDPNRIGTIGHSLGAKEAFYLLAFDDRVHAGVASEGGMGPDSTNWEAAWYLGPNMKSPKFGRDHHELVGLIAPRPFLVLGGETGRGCADGDRSWPYVEAGHAVSKLYGQSPRQALLNHHEGHAFSAASHQKSFEWLRAYVADRNQ